VWRIPQRAPAAAREAHEGILHMKDDHDWTDKDDVPRSGKYGPQDDHNDHHGDKHAHTDDGDDRGGDDNRDGDRSCTQECDDENDGCDLHAVLASMSDVSAILDTAISQLDAGSFDVAGEDVADVGSDFPA
jgi:hypothetical protein